MSIFSKKDNPICPLCKTTISESNKIPVSDGFICPDCITHLGLRNKELSNISITTLIAPPENDPPDEHYTAWEAAKLTVFLYWVRKGKAISNDKNYYPQYFKYYYGIENCVAYHERLLTEGYLEKPNLCLQLKTLKVMELKVILRSLNLPQNGKKGVLVNRILEQGSPALINQFMGEVDLYVLSQKGLNFLEEHFDYVDFHRCEYDIGFNEYQSMKEELQKIHIYTFFEIIKTILNNQIIEYTLSNQFGLLRNAYLYMAQLLLKYKKEKDAFQFYAIVLFLDFNIDYYSIIECKDNESSVPQESSFIEPLIAPGVIGYLEALSEHYSAIEFEFVLSKINLPYIIISKKNFVQLLGKMIIYGEDCIAEYLPEMRENFIKCMKYN